MEEGTKPGHDPGQHVDQRRLLLRPRDRQERRLRRQRRRSRSRSTTDRTCAPAVGPIRDPRPGRRLAELERPDGHRLGPRPRSPAPPTEKDALPRSWPRSPSPPRRRRRLSRRHRGSRRSTPRRDREPVLRLRQEPRRRRDPGRRPRRTRNPNLALRRPRRRRLVDPVLPLPGPVRPRAGVVVRAAGQARPPRPRPASAPTTSSARTSTAPSTILSLGGTRFPVPELAVGRLVETAARGRAAMLDAYLGAPDDAAQTITPDDARWSPATSSSRTRPRRSATSSTARHHGLARTRLINDTWTADQLRTKLLGAPTDYDLVYLAGHFDADALLRGRQHDDPQRHRAARPRRQPHQHARVQHRLPRGLQPRRHRRDHRRHPDARLGPGPRPQGRDARRRDRLPVRRRRARRVQRADLRRVRPPAARRAAGRSRSGQALVKSKLAYLAATPEIKGMHQKALLTARRLRPADVLGQHARHAATPSAGRWLDRVTATPGRRRAYGDRQPRQHRLRGPGAPATRARTGTTYFTGRDGVASNPGEPALPRYVANVDVAGKVLRGHRVPGRRLHRDAPASRRSPARRARSSVAPRRRSRRRPSTPPGCGRRATSAS